MDHMYKKSPSITLSELYDMKKKKETNRTKCFDHIMELCHRRIRNIASYGGLNCFYEIPGLLIGFPIYNLDECTSYIVEKLRKSGFLVQLLPPPHISVIYISWDPNELKPRRPAITDQSSFSNGRQNQNHNRNMHLIDMDNHNHRTKIQNVNESKMISSSIKPRITNPLKDRFRLF